MKITKYLNRNDTMVDTWAGLKGKCFGYSLCSRCALYDEFNLDSCPIEADIRYFEKERGVQLAVWECYKFEPLYPSDREGWIRYICRKIIEYSKYLNPMMYLRSLRKR